MLLAHSEPKGKYYRSENVDEDKVCLGKENISEARRGRANMEIFLRDDMTSAAFGAELLECSLIQSAS